MFGTIGVHEVSFLKFFSLSRLSKGKALLRLFWRSVVEIGGVQYV